MRSHAAAALALSVLFLAGCASGRSASGLGAARVKLIEPEVVITQLSGVPPVARHTVGGLPVQYRLRVSNRSAEPITLTNVSVTSVGIGAYTLPPGSRPFKTTIAPDHFEEVDFWMSANVDDPTIHGNNGPVTVRVVARFDSPVGQFENISIQQVNAMPGRTGRQ